MELMLEPLLLALGRSHSVLLLRTVLRALQRLLSHLPRCAAAAAAGDLAVGDFSVAGTTSLGVDSVVSAEPQRSEIIRLQTNLILSCVHKDRGAGVGC
eukprot:SAG11_NODE_14870_length_597_cov_0.819277_2_plen_98_part_00